MRPDVLAMKSVPETEYSVYVYFYAQDIENGHTDWEMKAMTSSADEAIDKAQELFNTRNFKKVEIKKKYFDTRYGRVVDSIYKVFQDKKRTSRRASVMALLGLSCFVCLGLVFVPFVGQF